MLNVSILIKVEMRQCVPARVSKNCGNVQLYQDYKHENSTFIQVNFKDFRGNVHLFFHMFTFFCN